MVDTILPSIPRLLVLRALADQSRHGYAIARWVENASNGVLTLKEGTLYPLLHVMEREGLLESHWVEAEGARAAKWYRLTPQGLDRLRTEYQVWAERAPHIDQILAHQGGLLDVYGGLV